MTVANRHYFAINLHILWRLIGFRAKKAFLNVSYDMSGPTITEAVPMVLGSSCVLQLHLSESNFSLSEMTILCYRCFGGERGVVHSVIFFSLFFSFFLLFSFLLVFVPSHFSWFLSFDLLSFVKQVPSCPRTHTELHPFL